MLATALTGAMIAISFSAPPGPVTMETIRRGLRGGFSPALRVQLGSIIGDFMWFLIALIGLGQLAQIAVIRGALAIIGVGLLLYLGFCGIRDTFKSAAPGVEQGSAIDMKQGAFRSGLAISIANPMAIGYWLSIGGTLVATGIAGQSGGETASFVLGFVAGTFAWAFMMAFAVRFGKQILHPNLFRTINFVCGAALMIFGIALARQMLS